MGISARMTLVPIPVDPQRIKSKRTQVGFKDLTRPVILHLLSGLAKGWHFGSLCCSGLISIRQSRPFPDPLVKIYDLRTMRSLSPIAFSSGPAFIHVLPKRASTIVIVSNQGLVNIVDVVNPAAASEFYQAISIRLVYLYLV